MSMYYIKTGLEYWKPKGYGYTKSREEAAQGHGRIEPRWLHPGTRRSGVPGRGRPQSRPTPPRHPAPRLSGALEGFKGAPFGTGYVSKTEFL